MCIHEFEQTKSIESNKKINKRIFKDGYPVVY